MKVPSERKADLVMSNVLRMVNFPKEQFRIALRDVLEKKRKVQKLNIDFIPVELEVAQKIIQVLESNITDELERCAVKIIRSHSGWKEYRLDKGVKVEYD